ncbi:hypothetical protein M6B38_126720 [Iris pallida]|uniref:Uncharacterized protein n=1 Tax=Iris pallida TaxID=29817 RepID=A0AAX6GD95_IRIPA|nr:hypothetical protein M6B38_371150 [Iris pallida]KAJ6827522.1 hypothetical protein M6B38_126720 [Iris pallida]
MWDCLHSCSWQFIIFVLVCSLHYNTVNTWQFLAFCYCVILAHFDTLNYSGDFDIVSFWHILIL